MVTTPKTISKNLFLSISKIFFWRAGPLVSRQSNAIGHQSAALSQQSHLIPSTRLRIKASQSHQNIAVYKLKTKPDREWLNTSQLPEVQNNVKLLIQRERKRKLLDPLRRVHILAMTLLPADRAWTLAHANVHNDLKLPSICSRCPFDF